jgi:hypothetical protein
MDDTNNTTAPAAQGQLEIPSEIRTFLEGILQDANIASVDEVMHQELINELYARFDSFLAAKIIDNLPPESVEKFIVMNEENRAQEEIQKFMMENIPNAEDAFAQIFIEFRERYLGDVLIARDDQALAAGTLPDVEPMREETKE